MCLLLPLATPKISFSQICHRPTISYDGIIVECKLFSLELQDLAEAFFDVDFEDEDDDYKNHQAPSTSSKTTSDAATTNNIDSPILGRPAWWRSTSWAIRSWRNGNYNPIYIYKSLWLFVVVIIKDYLG